METNDDHRHTRLLKGLSVRPFYGCGGCALNGVCQGRTVVTTVRLKHTGQEVWDCGGNRRRAFARNAVVDVALRHDTTDIYCAYAESTVTPGIFDYIHLDNFEESNHDSSG